MKIKYGIIATAAISKRFVGAVSKTNGEVIAVGSRSYKSAKDFADEFSILKAYGSYEEVYQDSEVNTVYIATINNQHIAEIKKALSYGKHVLCEKPLGLNVKEVQEVFNIAKENGLFIMEMQKSIFLPITTIIKEYIDTKTLGDLHQISMSASFDSPTATWMHEPTQGGVVYGSASYTFEYLDYLLEPRDTVVQALTTKEDSGTIDAVNMNIKMDEVLITSHISMKGTSESYATFYFEKGYITTDSYWKARKCQIYIDKQCQIIDKPVEYEMEYELTHVESCLENGLLESLVMPKERTLRCIQWVEEIMNKQY